MADYIANFGNEENIRRNSRVKWRHRIGRPNAMASVASDEAILLMEDIKKNALSRGVLKKSCKLTWKHLWPRVYSVFTSSFSEKKISGFANIVVEMKIFDVFALIL